MRRGWSRPICRKKRSDGLLMPLGVVLIAAGLILLFACIPGWAWAALAGIVLIAVGYVLVRMESGR